MQDLLITIAIPAYNNEKTIKKTIDSCLGQDTDIEYEILIVDDASTDSTPEILTQYQDPKLRVVRLSERVPLIANHNECFKNAFGQYILFCHADDALEDHAIETFADKLKQRNYPKKYIVWGHSMFRDFSAKAIKQAEFSYNEIAVGEYAPLMFLYGGLTPTGTLYSRESFVKAGGFLKVDMNSSPSDMTTMIYLAMNGFRFEMIDEMVLNRAGSSTAIQEAGETRYLGELDDAFKYFIKQVDQKTVTKLISMSSKQKIKPFHFYHTIIQNPYHKKQIKAVMKREIIKKPLILRSLLVRKLMKRLYTSH